MQIFAQQKNDTVSLTQQDILGTWQQNDSIIGAGLNQNFVFYKDSTFVLNMENMSEDARMLVGLKGKYRIIKDEIFFTITSRTVVDEGKVDVCEGFEGCIFFINNEKLKEIPENNPQELEPRYLVVLSNKHIEINNVDYFKIDEKDLQ